ncbi:MAG TPA: N-formylglutamate amidohydrolase [Flavobacteriaceae bacterium]|nr:N-formylglutamate amidohydrolase [Flavobacteriaceae bacterium]
MKLVLTCEHAGNELPEIYVQYFEGFKRELDSHKGFDLGALDVFNQLKPLSDFSIFNTISRLLIELNRSRHHHQLFSRISKRLPTEDKDSLVKTVYQPYRESVEHIIKTMLLQGEQVLHLSIHSFTPILNGEVRACDIGILYDPKRLEEKQFASTFKNHLLRQLPNLIVRFNYPYRGEADGFTTYLRPKFKTNYLGIELEINQKYATDNIMHPNIKDALFNALVAFKQEV